MSFISKNKREIYLMLCSMFLSLVLGASALELYFFQKYWHGNNTQFDSELGWSPIPSSTIIEKGKKYSTNSMGFRSESIDFNKKHILMLGDSVTWGRGVNDTETVSFFLNQKLKNAQVLNLGVSGYGPDQSFLRLKKHIGSLNPQWIILVIYSGNDLNDISSNIAYGKSKPFFLKTNPLLNLDLDKNNKKFKLLETKISPYSCPNIVSRSFILSLPIFYNLAFSACDIRKHESGVLIDELFSFLIQEVKKIGDNRGVKTLFVLSPHRPILTLKNSYEYLKLRNSTEKLSSSSQSVHRQEFINQAENFFYLQNKMSNFGEHFIDFFSIIQKNNWKRDEMYLENDLDHLSPLGHQRLANVLYDVLRKNDND